MRVNQNTIIISSKIQKLFSKITKIGLWSLAATFFLSGAKLDKQPLVSSLVSYDYTMQVSGGLNKSFSGIIDFETANETTSKGRSFSTLKLKLYSNDDILPHSLEFLIAREDSKEILPSGTYRVARNKNGLLNYFESVFGYANIDALGEAPLFAKNGKIRIDHLNNSIIEGSIDVELNNAVGQFVYVKGFFSAKK